MFPLTKGWGQSGFGADRIGIRIHVHTYLYFCMLSNS